MFRSGDSTARIWKIAEATSRSGVQNGPLNALVLKHVKGRTNEKSKDVTTLDWNVSLLHTKVISIVLFSATSFFFYEFFHCKV